MAGGILICKMGWGILNADNEEKEKNTSAVPTNANKVQSMLFYPLAFPMTTGGGTISVLLALSANSYDPERLSHTFKMLALITSCVLMALAIFVCYYYAPSILKRLGKQGYQVVNRLSGFLTFCVGLQIFVNGLTGIIHSFK
jgi:multiple antibiotic resistance protein